MTEEELIQMIKEQREESLNLLAERYEKVLLYVISGILGNRAEDIEECLNDTWLKLWRNIEQYDFNKASLGTWLKVIARNTALNRLRDVKRHEDNRYSDEDISDVPNLADAKHSVEDQAERSERAARLNDIVRSLPEKERELMIRRYYYNQSSKHIASVMGMTVNAVDSKLSRLRTKMREEFGEWQ